ncbi:hypothetical protein ACFY2R_06630 [Micromonospora olivasterospora]|nr:hypothetical protein [Micromonospora olivasterospora]
MRRHRGISMIAVAAALTAASCTDAGERPDGDSTEGRTTAVAAPPCPADHRYGTGLAEVAGTPGVFWALLFIDGAELRAGRLTKIAFRITGHGDLTLAAEGPDGARVEPADVTGHTGGSTWQRPGDEWGSQWTFPTAGCWTVRAERTDGTRAALSLRAG